MKYIIIIIVCKIFETNHLDLLKINGAQNNIGMTSAVCSYAASQIRCTMYIISKGRQKQFQALQEYNPQKNNSFIELDGNFYQVSGL